MHSAQSKMTILCPDIGERGNEGYETKHEGTRYNNVHYKKCKNVNIMHFSKCSAPINTDCFFPKRGNTEYGFNRFYHADEINAVGHTLPKGARFLWGFQPVHVQTVTLFYFQFKSA